LTLLALVAADDVAEVATVAADPAVVPVDPAIPEGEPEVVTAALPALIPIALRIALGQVMGLALTKVDQLLSASTTLIQQLPNNAYFVSSLNGSWGTYSGQLLAAYYHPTCVHRASTTGKLGLKRSVAGAGVWAVSMQTRGLWGNKSNYLTCCGLSQTTCYNM
jgi:hypothetical protein